MWYEGLLFKLEGIGILGNLLSLLKSFLSNTGIEITDFQTPDKTSNTIKYPSDIISACLGSRVQAPPTCLPAKMYYDNFWSASIRNL